MAQPETDLRDVDEARQALGGLVAACGDGAGILEPVQAPLDQVPRTIQGTVETNAHHAGFPLRHHRQHPPFRFEIRPASIRGLFRGAGQPLW